MNERLGTSISGTFAAAVPFVCGLLGVIVTNIPVSVLRGTVPPPLFSLMAIYFWCLVRPDLMPPAAAFALGVLEDFLSGGPPGVWALSFVITYALIDRERDAFAGLSGFAALLGFAASMLVASMSAWLIASFVYGRFPPLVPLSIEFAVSVVVYIPMAMLFGLIHRHLVGPLRSEF
ncbi:MAG TPA: rod shape-determining protein MreD [Rhizomicrobium sp.]|nr:rod shape-determining protein MreD [Rhizomicrobium sp.]